MGDRPDRSSTKNRKRADRRRALSRLASTVQRAGLMPAVEYALRRWTEGDSATVTLQHHPSDRKAQLVNDDDAPMLVLPIHANLVLIDGDSIAVPMTALEDVIMDIIGVPAVQS